MAACCQMRVPLQGTDHRASLIGWNMACFPWVQGMLEPSLCLIQLILQASDSLLVSSQTITRACWGFPWACALQSLLLRHKHTLALSPVVFLHCMAGPLGLRASGLLSTGGAPSHALIPTSLSTLQHVSQRWRHSSAFIEQVEGHCYCGLTPQQHMQWKGLCEKNIWPLTRANKRWMNTTIDRHVSSTSTPTHKLFWWLTQEMWCDVKVTFA